MGNLFQIGHGRAAKRDTGGGRQLCEAGRRLENRGFHPQHHPRLSRRDILQVLLCAILFGFSLVALGERGEKLRGLIDDSRLLRSFAAQTR